MRLIDILNKIANGELKEGTKVKLPYDNCIYELCDYELVDEWDAKIFEKYKLSVIVEECELIEPQEPTECEHEWQNYTRHRVNEGTIRSFKRCVKCGLEEDIESTDNTKIEELKYVLEELQNPTYNESWLINCIRANRDKLNEVISVLNKRS